MREIGQYKQESPKSLVQSKSWFYINVGLTYSLAPSIDQCCIGIYVCVCVCVCIEATCRKMGRILGKKCFSKVGYFHGINIFRF